jgi:hypothetical protein
MVWIAASFSELRMAIAVNGADSQILFDSNDYNDWILLTVYRMTWMIIQKSTKLWKIPPEVLSHLDSLTLTIREVNRSCRADLWEWPRSCHVRLRSNPGKARYSWVTPKRKAPLTQNLSGAWEWMWHQTILHEIDFDFASRSAPESIGGGTRKSETHWIRGSPIGIDTILKGCEIVTLKLFNIAGNAKWSRLSKRSSIGKIWEGWSFNRPNEALLFEFPILTSP